MGYTIRRFDTLCSISKRIHGYSFFHEPKARGHRRRFFTFYPLFQESRDSDIVKKIQLENTELYLIALIEHQSEADADMSFRLLRYMVYVWTDYTTTHFKAYGLCIFSISSYNQCPCWRNQWPYRPYYKEAVPYDVWFFWSIWCTGD